MRPSSEDIPCPATYGDDEGIFNDAGEVDIVGGEMVCDMLVDTGADDLFVRERNAALTSRRARSDDVKCFAESVRLLLGSAPPLTWSASTTSSRWIRSHVWEWISSWLFATRRNADAIVRCRLIQLREQ